MRRFFLLAMACVSVGCGTPPEHLKPSTSLTKAQTERQVELLQNAELPFEYKKLVGLPSAQLRELLSLANETKSNADEIDYIYIIPGVGDGGTSGRLVITVSCDKINYIHYGAPDW